MCFRQRNNKNRTVVRQHEKMDKGEKKVMKNKKRNLLMMMMISKYLHCRLNELQNRRLDRCINEHISLRITLPSLMMFLVQSECFW